MFETYVDVVSLNHLLHLLLVSIAVWDMPVSCGVYSIGNKWYKMKG